MLLFEEAVEAVKSQEGMLLVPLSALQLYDENIENIFINTIKFLNNKKPRRVTANMPVNATGVTMPEECMSVIALRPLVYNNFPKLGNNLDRKYWDYNMETRLLTCLTSYQFVVVYNAKYTVDNLQTTYKETYVTEGEDVLLPFKLKGSFKKNSLKIKKGTKEMAEVSRTDTVVTLGGTLGTGTINLSTLETELTLTDTTAGDLTITFWTRRKAAKELDMGNIMFVKLFAANLMTSFGALKSQSKIADFPFDISLDELQRRGEELKREVEADWINQNSAWWQWGY